MEDRVKHKKMGLAFKIVNAINAMQYLTKHLQRVCDTHRHNTRGCANNDLITPVHKTNMGKFSFYCHSRVELIEPYPQNVYLYLDDLLQNCPENSPFRRPEAEIVITSPII